MRISDWSSDVCSSDLNQARTYRWRDHVVRLLAEERYLEMAAPLTEISIFDLSQRQIRSFPAYRFLYERLIGGAVRPWLARSEEHTSELQSLMRISYAVFCLKKKKNITHIAYEHHYQCLQQDQ